MLLEFGKDAGRNLSVYLAATALGPSSANTWCTRIAGISAESHPEAENYVVVKSIRFSTVKTDQASQTKVPYAVAHRTTKPRYKLP